MYSDILSDRRCFCFLFCFCQKLQSSRFYVTQKTQLITNGKHGNTNTCNEMLIRFYKKKRETVLIRFHTELLLLKKCVISPLFLALFIGDKKKPYPKRRHSTVFVKQICLYQHRKEQCTSVILCRDWFELHDCHRWPCTAMNWSGHLGGTLAFNGTCRALFLITNDL